MLNFSQLVNNIANSDMSQEAWWETYQPVKNALTNAVSLEGYIFGTTPAELQKVRDANPQCVWTLLKYEDGQVITNGSRFVNRVGYFITEVPFDGGPGEYLEIPFESIQNDCD